jgi:crotonobetainyl-CoA:carnitine CoA-transferase CaiB-like acyl-CoA transferase
MTNTLPLAGIRVVEFSHMVMGPTSGLILADLGADVIKIEPIGQGKNVGNNMGDNTRRLPGSGAGFFPAFNRNKRSLALDLKNPKAITFAKRLIAKSDVVTENFRPGGLEAMGLGYKELSAQNPGLIYAQLKGFLSGPYENRAALDEVVQMMGGLAYMTGPVGKPMRAGAPVNDIMGGMFAVIGILAALQERQRTGHGQLIKSALFENTAFLVSPHMAQFAVTGKSVAPMAARVAAWAVYDVFETSDDLPIFIGVVSDTQWRAFCEEYARPDLASDPTLQTNALRVAARDRLIPELRRVFKLMTRAEISAKCERARLSFAPVNKPEDLFTDPHLAVPGAMVGVSLPDGRKMPMPALPLEMNGRRFGLRRDIQRVGESSAEIAAEIGFAPDEIADLQTANILGTGNLARSETDTQPVKI